VLEPLNLEDVRAQCEKLKGEGVDAVAVCFLHSYQNPAHERAAGEVVEEDSDEGIGDSETGGAEVRDRYSASDEDPLVSDDESEETDAST